MLARARARARARRARARAARATAAPSRARCSARRSTLDPPARADARRAHGRRSSCSTRCTASGPTGTVQPHLAAGAAGARRSAHDRDIAIRKGVAFHDGSDADAAADVAASLERAARAARGGCSPACSRSRATATRSSWRCARRSPTSRRCSRCRRPAITKGGKAPRRASRSASGPFAVDALDRSAQAARAARVRRSLRGPAVPRSADARAGTTRPTARRAGSRPARRRSRRAASARSPARSRSSAPTTSRARRRCSMFVGFGRGARRRHRRPRVSARARSRARSRRARVDHLGRARGADARAGARSRPAARRSTRPARDGDLSAAQARARGRRRSAVPRSRPASSPQLKLEILVEDTRPDDREIAERVVLALDKLGIALDDHGARRARRCAIASRRAHAICGSASSRRRSRARRCGGRRRSRPAATTGRSQRGSRAAALDARVGARRRSRARLPIVPLMFRSVRMWHRTDVRGLAFDASGRPVLRGSVRVRRPGAPQRQAVKLRGRFTLTLALAALVPIAVAAVVTTPGDRGRATARATQSGGRAPRTRCTCEIERISDDRHERHPRRSPIARPSVRRRHAARLVEGNGQLDMRDARGGCASKRAQVLRWPLARRPDRSPDPTTSCGVAALPRRKLGDADPRSASARRERAASAYFVRDEVHDRAPEIETVLVVQAAQLSRGEGYTVALVGGRRVKDDDARDVRPRRAASTRASSTPNGDVLAAADRRTGRALAKDPPITDRARRARRQAGRVRRGRGLRRRPRRRAAQAHADLRAARARRRSASSC